MSNLINAFIFDLDGVLCDTAKYHFLAWKKLAEQLAIPFTEADNERLKGVSRMDSLDILLSLGSVNASNEEKELLADKKNEYYKSLIANLTPEDLLPGVLDFLNETKKLHIKTALASVSKNAIAILSRLSIAHFFDCIVDGTCITNAKPDPEVFLKALASISAAPQEAVVFEDAAAGVTAAHKAGIFCVGIGSSALLPEADFTISDFQGRTPCDMINLTNKSKGE